ncbi:CBN-HMIT-1.1 protein [Aphelenchoides avenae]|nr:CBN-HMIT-1.1 protein [Aphelenchus avenae]
MAGFAVTSSADAYGKKRPVDSPELGWYVYLLAFVAVIGGFLFGYDTGIVSAAMLYVPTSSYMVPMDSLWQESIIAITPGMACIGALFAGSSADYFGRKPLIIVSSIIFVVGAVICGAATGKVVLLVGRFFLGIAIGALRLIANCFASMIVPIYVSEASPTHIRGKMLTGFNLMVTFGQMASNVVAGGLSYIEGSDVAWRLMFGLAAVPAIIQLVGFFFLPESPRWLYARRSEQASRKVLTKIYNDDQAWVDFEVSEIADMYQQDKLERETHVSEFTITRVLRTSHVRKALLIGCSLQAFQQLSGINTIMYYTGTIIKSTGIRDNHTTIWLSVVTSAVNFAGNLIPFVIVERYGRRRVLLCSVAATVVTLSLLGTSFLLINRDTAEVLPHPSTSNSVFNTGVSGFERCSSYSNCDFCVTDESCGFCAEEGVGKSPGYCLPRNPHQPEKYSVTGFCSENIAANSATLNGTQYEWSSAFCHTKYTFLPIVLMVLYLCLFSAGYAPLPWLLNAEFYPLWARGTCVSVSTFCNWAFNLLISLTFLSLSQGVTKFGAFYIYAFLTAVGLVIFWKYVPETTNCSLDEIEILFMSDKQRALYSRSRRSVDSSSDEEKASTRSAQNSYQ